MLWADYQTLLFIFINLNITCRRPTTMCNVHCWHIKKKTTTTKRNALMYNSCGFVHFDELELWFCLKLRVQHIRTYSAFWQKYPVSCAFTEISKVKSHISISPSFWIQFDEWKMPIFTAMAVATNCLSTMRRLVSGLSM